MDPIRYHELSKHHPDRYAPGPGRLDWATQPDPFRTFEGAPVVALPLGAEGLTRPFDDVRRGTPVEAAPFDLRHVGLLLELSLALSAWKAYGGSRWALRCNPSSGNLHPIEAALVVPPMDGLDAGVWHYDCRDHALQQRLAAGGDWAQGWTTGPGFFVVLSAIAWREAWKYGVRAFRYTQHDCGHAIGALAYAAGTLGWTARVLSASTRAIGQLTGIDLESAGSDPERPEPEALLWIGTHGDVADWRTLATIAARGPWIGVANRLSAAHRDWPEIAAVQVATRQPDASEVSIWPTPEWPPLTARADPLPASALIRKRRSAVAFDGVTTLPAQDFHALLDATLPRAGVPPWSTWPARAGVHLVLFVHRVDGVAPGLYCLLRDPDAFDEVSRALAPDALWARCGPAHLPLYRLAEADVREVAQHISCHQEIAADSCFSLGMVGSMAAVSGEPARYRDRFRECGLIGQVLYLEAEAAGVRATGIGCFFDDAMHRLLGLESNAWQSLYHFTIGGPLEDTRLTTLPPYAGRRA